MVRMKWVLVLMLCLSAVLSYAGPKPNGRFMPANPDGMFASIAEDLKLTGNQRTEYEKITAEMKDIKQKFYGKKLEEFKNFIDLINKGDISDSDIDGFDKVRSDNDIAFQSEMAVKIQAIYSILDKNQQKRFIDKMTPKMPDDKKDRRESKGSKKPKDKQKGANKGKRQAPPDRPDMGYGEPDDMGYNGFDDNRMPSPDRFADKGDKHPKGDKNKKADRKKPNAGGRGNEVNGHHGKMMHYGADSPERILLGFMVRELNLDKSQSEMYRKIKDEIHQEMKQCSIKDKEDKKAFGAFDYLVESKTAEQINTDITQRIDDGAQLRKFIVKKYFDFYNCLTDAQKEVVKLKYQYDMAKLSLPRPNDRK